MPRISKIQWSESLDSCLHSLLTDRCSQPTPHLLLWSDNSTTSYIFISLLHAWIWIFQVWKQIVKGKTLFKDEEGKEQQVNQHRFKPHNRPGKPTLTCSGSCSSIIPIPQAEQQCAWNGTWLWQLRCSCLPLGALDYRLVWKKLPRCLLGRGLAQQPKSFKLEETKSLRELFHISISALTRGNVLLLM